MGRRSGRIYFGRRMPEMRSEKCRSNRHGNAVKCMKRMKIQIGNRTLQRAALITSPQPYCPIVRVAREMRHCVDHDLVRGFKINNCERESPDQHPASSPNAWLSMLRARSSIEEGHLGCAPEALAQPLAFFFVVPYFVEKLTTRVRK